MSTSMVFCFLFIVVLVVHVVADFASEVIVGASHRDRLSPYALMGFWRCEFIHVFGSKIND